MSKHLIVIAGPTAIGKTNIAIQLAKYFNTAIISADSRQCYREMSIGTAKPSKQEQDQVQHYFVDSHSISEDLNAGDYEQLALKYLDIIFEKNDVAVVVGGTGLYLRALCEGIDEMPEINREIEQQINEQYKENGLLWLQEKLKTEDPSFFEDAEQDNPHRLIRALIFKLSTGKSIVEFKTGVKKERAFNIIKIGLELPRAELYQRINQRVLQMMDAGLLKEVEQLLPFQNLKNLQTVGYSELFDYFNGKISLEKAGEKIQQHSRNYAKRQMTWFKKDKEINWFSPVDKEKIISFLEKEIK